MVTRLLTLRIKVDCSCVSNRARARGPGSEEIRPASRLLGLAFGWRLGERRFVRLTPSSDRNRSKENARLPVGVFVFQMTVVRSSGPISLLIKVNRLLTITIKVNVPVTAESQSKKKGQRDEEQGFSPRLLGMATWQRLVQRRIERLTPRRFRISGSFAKS